MNYKLHAIDMVRSGQVSAKDLLLDIYNTMSHRDLADDALQMSGANINGEVSKEEFIKFLEHIRERDVYDSLATNGHVPDVGDLDNDGDSSFGSDSTMHESMNGLVSSLINNKSPKEKSFRDYLPEAGTAIVPPSGNTISPTANAAPGQQASNAPAQVKSIWPGKGAPIEMGMTVGLKGPNGIPVPGQVSQVDASAKGVKVKNPTTGQDEWVNMDALQPFMAGGKPNANIQPGAGTNQQSVTTTAEDAGQLTRLRELAGIKENCSAGATGAGSIAVAPAAMGSIRKRQPTDEQVKKEYTPKEAAKTIAGDTKPSQASGELSANLAARGKKSAGRINNGFKR